MRRLAKQIEEIVRKWEQLFKSDDANRHT